MNNQTKAVSVRRTFMGLPDDILSIIISYCSYGEISELRLVCHRFNRVCQRLLNQGIQMLERYHGACLRSLKSQLPRRESERRNHPLAKHCDILSAVETRLSLLAMTYTKYIDLKLTCFIPGKVIDEAFHVLRVVMQSKEVPKIHELLQELRDISSMAMEHFDEKIAPALKKKVGDSRNVLMAPTLTPGELSDKTKSPTVVHGPPLAHINKLQAHFRAMSVNISQVRKEVINLKSQLQESRKVAEEQRRKLVYQQQVISELAGQLSAQKERTTQQNLRLVLLEQKLLGVSGSTSIPPLMEKKISLERDGPPSPQEEGEIDEEGSTLESVTVGPSDSTVQGLTDCSKVLKFISEESESDLTFFRGKLSFKHVDEGGDDDSVEGDLVVEEGAGFADLEDEIFAVKDSSGDENRLEKGKKRKSKDHGEDSTSKRKRQKKRKVKGQTTM